MKKTPKEPPERTLEERKGDLKKAVVMSFNAINAIGTKKRESRFAYNHELQREALAAGATPEEVSNMPFEASPWIHSISTFEQYVYICKQYAEWLAKTYSEVTALRFAYRKGYSRKFIQIMIDNGYAPSSINRATCALAKLYRCTSNDIHDARPKRCYIDFTRSRSYCEESYRRDLIKYMDKFGPIVELCRYTGVRELELENLYPECFQENSKGQLYVHLDGKKQNAKGGKTRDIVIIPANQERMRAILAGLKPGKLICPIAPSHLDIHGIRSMYATDYYNSIARKIEHIPETERIPRKHPKVNNKRGTIQYDDPGVYRRQSDGKKFDRKAVLIVSNSLGHNREDVMIASYLR